MVREPVRIGPHSVRRRTGRPGYDAQLTSNDTYLKRYDFSQARPARERRFHRRIGRAHAALPSPDISSRACAPPTRARSFRLRCRWSNSASVRCNRWLGGQFRFDFNSVSLTRDVGVDSQRATAEARMRWPTVLPGGQLLTFELDARGDFYHVANAAAAGRSSDKFISRGIPYAALDWRWPFISSTRRGTRIHRRADRAGDRCSPMAAIRPAFPTRTARRSNWTKTIC